MAYLLVASCILWVIITLLPWRPWRVAERWEASLVDPAYNLSDVTVVIPARNEAAVIANTLTSVVQQGSNLTIILIDDQSDDNTGEIARQVSGAVRVLRSADRPTGWTGKLWALEQGIKRVQTPYTLLLDADIALNRATIGGLRDKLKRENWDGVSLMAKPPLDSFWEKLLMPAFIYFFKLLYPFRLANSSFKYVAAAAGGCILLKTEVLEKIGGFEPMKSAVIDDCTLASKIKQAGFRTWLGLTHAAKSVRPYNGLNEIWDMVARTAYTQLLYSLSLLLLCTAIMILAYWIPIIGILMSASPVLTFIAFLTILFMTLTYIPTLLYYRIPIIFSFCLPIIGTLYLAMTWTSAIRYWKGERLRWRGRLITQE